MKLHSSITRIFTLGLMMALALLFSAKPGKVKVFIIMGQSNTLEMGRVKGDKEGTLEHAVKNEQLYPFMVDDSGNWTTRKDAQERGTLWGAAARQNARDAQRLADRIRRQDRHRDRNRTPTR